MEHLKKLLQDGLYSISSRIVKDLENTFKDETNLETLRVMVYQAGENGILNTPLITRDVFITSVLMGGCIRSNDTKEGTDVTAPFVYEVARHFWGRDAVTTPLNFGFQIDDGNKVYLIAVSQKAKSKPGGTLVNQLKQLHDLKEKLVAKGRSEHDILVIHLVPWEMVVPEPRGGRVQGNKRDIFDRQWYGWRVWDFLTNQKMDGHEFGELVVEWRMEARHCGPMGSVQTYFERLSKLIPEDWMVNGVVNIAGIVLNERRKTPRLEVSAYQGESFPPEPEESPGTELTRVLPEDSEEDSEEDVGEEKEDLDPFGLGDL